MILVFIEKFYYSGINCTLQLILHSKHKSSLGTNFLQIQLKHYTVMQVFRKMIKSGLYRIPLFLIFFFDYFFFFFFFSFSSSSFLLRFFVSLLVFLFLYTPHQVKFTFSIKFHSYEISVHVNIQLSRSAVGAISTVLSSFHF